MLFPLPLHPVSIKHNRCFVPINQMSSQSQSVTLMRRYSTTRQVCECATIGCNHFPNSTSSQPDFGRYGDACSATAIVPSRLSVSRTCRKTIRNPRRAIPGVLSTHGCYATSEKEWRYPFCDGLIRICKVSAFGACPQTQDEAR